MGFARGDGGELMSDLDDLEYWDVVAATDLPTIKVYTSALRILVTRAKQAEKETQRHRNDMQNAIEMLQKVAATGERTKAEREVCAYLQAALIPIFPEKKECIYTPGGSPPGTYTRENMLKVECTHDSEQLDRTLCGACHGMHWYCLECGKQMDECDERC